SAITEYKTVFKKVFPEAKPALTYQNIAEAIAAFERTLITPSRFDDFMKGNTNALNESELSGLETFIKVNCVSCHDGAMLGGSLLEKMGKENAYANQLDQGLFEISKYPDDRMVFKVSSLRNVARTAPYFHDGKIASLEEAVRLMGHLQLNEKLNDKQVKDIVSFLGTLSGTSQNQ
ncbi:MAG: c-type cytochrome, partial [Gammaproteobacteria bacterium]|nr:c-type cytochrome [Gammaproteobacteria bacterium]